MKITSIGYNQNFYSIKSRNPQRVQISTSNTGKSSLPYISYQNAVSFQAGVIFQNDLFKRKFSKNFFRKLVAEGLNCAYTDKEMIPQADLDWLEKNQVFRRKSSVAITYLRKYKDQMFDIERQIFDMLERESKKHPNLKFQEILNLKFSSAEKALITQQSAILNRINLMSRALPEKEYRVLRMFINKAFDRIFEPNPKPERRFKRKDFIIKLSKLKISNKSIKQKLLQEAEKLPQSSNSVNAFIVKYSQPYKVQYLCDGYYQRIPRDSGEIGLRLLKPSAATDEHIYPQTLYRNEELARQNGDTEAQNLSSLMVTILTTSYINELKADKLFDQFVRSTKFDVKTNIQKHINRLIEICHKWDKEGKIDDANKLADYILILKEEFTRRSKIVSINIDEFEKYIPKLRLELKEHRAGNPRKIITEAETSFENRKHQKHKARFSK